ncbi:iron dicitrate transport regulator FecR [Ramlibacter terrae]|uniref:Iron dicitrate transport regulator FecR n=1 Tax=Ramlibacter terrae TaxID=2732511 RepID=A0ABX6P1V4_9BURK|nr:iron dicitrate transport regulator FecR [Ramlibacter terrae]
MSQHALLDRTEAELLWFRRRHFIQAAAAWTAAGGFTAAHAQQRSNVVQLEGDVLLNGQRMRPDNFVQSGDRIDTGPGSTLVFAVGNSAFHVRQNSRITVERGATLNTVSVLRLLTGAVVSVWGRGSNRQIVTPTLTAGIRGTGVYTEVFAQENYRSYFCNCYGTVELAAGGERAVSQASYHQSYWGEAQPRGGRMLTPALAINHTDEEVEFVAALINQRTAWQIEGRRGVKDGSGYMDPGRNHPLTR